MSDDACRDDIFFEQLAASTDIMRPPEQAAPEELKSKIVSELLARDEESLLFDDLRTLSVEERAPSRLKCRIYSALVSAQQDTGPLLGLSKTKRDGRGLCVFEDLVRIVPLGEKLNSFNYCRVCHARVLGERLEKAPIRWPHCPYSEFQGS